MFTHLITLGVFTPALVPDPDPVDDLVTPDIRNARAGEGGTRATLIGWNGRLDPNEVLDFIMDLARAPTGETSVLLPGEKVSSYSLAVTAQAALYGLHIEDDAPYLPALLGASSDTANDADTRIRVWLSVDPGQQNNAAFNSPGIRLGVVATILTDAVPPRRRQRTFTVEVVQL